MAIYHCSVSIGSRSSGSSSVAASAYREGKKIRDNRTGLTHDYSRKSDVIESFNMTPLQAPEWANDSAVLWNLVEATEKRKDAQLYREVKLALPRELDHESNKELVKEYCKKNFINEGMVASIAFHSSQTQNPHVHIMLTTRVIDKDGLGKKNRDWNSKGLLDHWREDWAKSVNNKLQEHGIDQSIDHRSLVDQGIDRLPQIHLGKTATAMERRGEASDRGNVNRDIAIKNNSQEPDEISQGIEKANQQFEVHKEQMAQQQKKDREMQIERERQRYLEQIEKRSKQKNRDIGGFNR
jgi:ATP-dependent exoDNAse (exonuclease V) alpha subunit